MLWDPFDSTMPGSWLQGCRPRCAVLRRPGPEIRAAEFASRWPDNQGRHNDLQWGHPGACPPTVDANTTFFRLLRAGDGRVGRIGDAGAEGVMKLVRAVAAAIRMSRRAESQPRSQLDLPRRQKQPNALGGLGIAPCSNSSTSDRVSLKKLSRFDGLDVRHCVVGNLHCERQLHKVATEFVALACTPASQLRQHAKAATRTYPYFNVLPVSKCSMQ